MLDVKCQRGWRQQEREQGDFQCVLGRLHTEQCSDTRIQSVVALLGLSKWWKQTFEGLTFWIPPVFFAFQSFISKVLRCRSSARRSEFRGATLTSQKQLISE